jgi:cyanate lyase
MRKYVLALTSCVTKQSHLALQFGDGIMSMIDCKVQIKKKEDPNGDRVELTFE